MTAYTQSMVFSDLVAEVQALRFTNTTNPTSTQVKRWVNDALARIWNADEWTFKYGKSSTVTATAGSTSLTTLPTDFGMALGLFRDDGYPVLYRPPRDFYDLYAASTTVAAPQHYTVFNQAITVGPIPATTAATWTLVYEKRLTNLVLDADTPAIPAQHHYLIVDGALSGGMRRMNDFTWEFQEQAFQAGIQDMRREWLVDQRGEVGTWGRDQIESLPTAWGT